MNSILKNFYNNDLPIDERLKDLVSNMTLEEKVGQMSYTAPEIPRLGIPAYNWWNECLHGIARAGKATVFPQAIGIAATFDPELVFRIASAISDEARAKYQAAVEMGNRKRYAGLTFWTPNVNIFRDPRWGRGQETYGEDPFLSGEIGAAFVRGLQGDDPDYLKTAACAKHFAVHSGPEGERHVFDARASLKDMYETYLPAFKRLVEAGVETVMGAYNRTNGEPCCGSPTLLQKILRDEWGFKGHITSDCWAILDFHEQHKVTKDIVESAALAVNNGCDLNCGSTYPFLLQAVKDGLVTEETIDTAVTKLFQTRIKLGLFDPPEKVPFNDIPASVVHCDKHVELARQAAQKSIVLLKNNGVLPLENNLHQIQLLGPHAASVEVLLGNYYGSSPKMVTLFEGLADKVGIGTLIEHKHSFLIDREKPNPIDWVTEEAHDSDVIIVALGLTGLLEGEEGEAIASPHKGDRLDYGLPDNQVAFMKKLRLAGEKPIVAVVTGGSPMDLSEIEPFVDAILFAWYPGEQGGNAIADILFGDIAPSGRLPITFPKSIDQLPPYENYDMQGRTYKYMTQEPMYPFGFGLSYSQFVYKALELDATVINSGECISATAIIHNNGTCDAEEVVQLYLADVQASVPVPQWELKAVQRVFIKAGEKIKVSFELTPEMMNIINAEGQSVLEPGEFKVWISPAAPYSRSVELGLSNPLHAVFIVNN